MLSTFFSMQLFWILFTVHTLVFGLTNDLIKSSNRPNKPTWFLLIYCSNTYFGISVSYTVYFWISKRNSLEQTQFYVQLVYTATPPFTLKSQTLKFNLFWTQKECFKVCYVFLIFKLIKLFVWMLHSKTLILDFFLPMQI